MFSEGRVYWKSRQCPESVAEMLAPQSHGPLCGAGEIASWCEDLASPEPRRIRLSAQYFVHLDLAYISKL